MDDRLLPERLRRALSSPPDTRRDTFRRDTFRDACDRDALECLLDIYALHLAPIDSLGGAEVWQHEPHVVALKSHLEDRFVARLGSRPPLPDRAHDHAHIGDAFRRLAHDDLVPPLYDWLADEADTDELVEFITFEGGPDADFDDLVAICQVGLSGLPKLTLAANYWDEMGDGTLAAVHTELHERMAESLGVRSLPLAELPVEALERKALNAYLAVNRARQPELLGSLGLLECQAGPRCRRVVTAMRRLGVAPAALPFYEEHALADPRHGKEWVDHAIEPLVAQRPVWGPRILRGAEWRASVNRRFFTAMEQHFGLARLAA